MQGQEADVVIDEATTPSAMPSERRAEMLAFIAQSGTASVAELARAFAVSPVTIHRDLQHLAEMGSLERVRGGARIAVPAEPGDSRTDWGSRIARAWEAKRAIARVALDEVDSGATVFLDASTTCFALAQEIRSNPPKALTIVTNSPAIVHEVRLEPLHLIVAPGEIDQNLSAIAGRWTEEFLAQLNFTTAFVSCAGVTERGIMSNQRNLSDTLRAASASASRTVALVDSTKFDVSGLTTIVPLERVDAMVTDGALPPATVERYRRAGLDLVLSATSTEKAHLDSDSQKEQP
jgi:DeoR family fructose operon transcriptional repressor